MRTQIVANVVIVSLLFVMAFCQDEKSDFQKAKENVKKYKDQKFGEKSKSQLKTATDELKGDIKKFKKERKDLDSETRKILRDSLKGLKDRYDDLDQAQKQSLCEASADSAATKGAGDQDAKLRNQGCAKLGSELAEKKLKQFGEGKKKRMRRFSNTKDLTQKEFQFGKGKMSQKLLQEACGNDQCTVLHEELETADVTISGKKIKGAQKFSLMKNDGTTISKKGTNDESKVELAFDGACPAKCLVASGDSTDFKQGSEVCTTAAEGGNCVLTSKETSTYVVADVDPQADSFSFRSIGYWFLGVVVSAVVIIV